LSAWEKQMNYAHLSAREALSAMSKGEITAEAYAWALIAQTIRFKALNAFIAFDQESFLEAARAADISRKAGKLMGPLHGLPIVVKDNIEFAELPTTAGTPALRQHQPKRNARVVQILLDAGALVMGKTNLHEIAFGLTSNNYHTGAVHNPYDRDLIAGGSSGGTAAALAAYMTPAGLGTDTGGSVRHPAAMCGIAGLRTSTGRYSLDGVVPLSRTRDTVGPMSRSVGDLGILDDAITNQTAPISPTSLKGLRLAVPHRHFYEQLDSEVAPVIDTALERLADLGTVLVNADIPDVETCNLEIARPISGYECIRELRRYLGESDSDITLEALVSEIASPDVRAGVQARLGDEAVGEEEYRAAQQRRRVFQDTYQRYFRDHNLAAVVFPTTRLPARPIGNDDTVEFMGERVPTTLAYVHNMAPASIIGAPGLSVPVGLTRSGIPVAMELDGPVGEDRALLAIGLSWEAAFPAPKPPLD
jgi:Asp-tRNA(Asn)/Glu-tRNA(Gln) amidotransferase A subunit family amidase